MKRFLLLALLLPTLGYAQTTTQKVLQMTAYRNVGASTKAYLSSDSSYVGPIFNLSTDTLRIVNTNGVTARIARKRLKEIRFTVETIEVPTEVKAVSANESQKSNATYDLSGRKVDEKALKQGIYIKGNKKYLKK